MTAVIDLINQILLAILTTERDALSLTIIIVHQYS